MVTISDGAETSARNAALIRDSFDAFNAKDTSRLLALVAPDLVTHYAEAPEPVTGRDAWLDGFRLMQRAFPDLTAHPHDIVAGGDRVTVRLTMTGTHTGAFQGMPATGRNIDYVSHEFYRLVDGVVTEEWICSDFATLLRQLS